MAKIITWKSKCRICGSLAYYYPAKLLLEAVSFNKTTDDEKPRIVDCSCTGEIGGVKHTLDYFFPKDFEKVE